MKLKIVSACAIAFLMAGCVSEGDGGGEIVPSVSPINLGKLWPQEGDPEPGSIERVPYEFVLLLQANDAPVKITSTCLIGDPGTINNNWILESEESLPAEVLAGQQYGLRITFERSNPGRDAIAVVVNNDSTNFPQLVIPLCAEVVPDGADKSVVSPCEYTAEVPADACK